MGLLRQIFEAVSSADKRQKKQKIVQAGNRIVDIADPKIRQVRGFTRTLSGSIEHSLEYCNHLVQSIPGGIVLSPQHYHSDPLIRSFFTSPDQVKEVISLQGKEGEPDSGNPQERYALLTMEESRKEIVTREQQGNMILGDVYKQTVNFFDHRLVCIAATEEQSKALLEWRALEVIAMGAQKTINLLRGNLAELRERRERLQAMRRILKGSSTTSALFARTSHTVTQKMEKLNQELTLINDQIESAREQVATPKDSIDLVEDVLTHPEDALFEYKQTLRLNWMNSIIEEQGREQGQDITFSHLTIPDELQRAAIHVCFNM